MMNLYAALLAKALGGSGGGGGALVVQMDANTNTLNKTWQEITDALSAGTIVVAVATYEFEDEIDITQTLFTASVWLDPSSYSLDGVSVQGGNVAGVRFIADTANDYPVLDM